MLEISITVNFQNKPRSSPSRVLDQLAADPNAFQISVLDYVLGDLPNRGKGVVVHAIDVSIMGPKKISGSSPVIKVSDGRMAAAMKARLELIDMRVSPPVGTLLPTPPGQLQVFTEDAKAEELDANSATLTGPEDDVVSSFVQSGFQPFTPAISIDSTALFRGSDGPKLDMRVP